MHSSPRLIGAILFALALALGSVASGDSARMAVTGAPVLTIAAPLDDPFPIARIRVPADQLEDALRTLDAGPVVRLSRAEFEARVQKAARAAVEERDPPRLIEAKYTATLSGSDLTGDAAWVILNRRATPAFLSLDPLKLAVQTPTWADGSESVIGSFGAGFAAGPGIWVPPGRQTLKLKWSATGTGFGADRQFDLRVPACTSTSLELELPVDRTPTNPADVLLTGPFPGVRDPKLKQWQFRFGERSRLEFGLRGPNEAGSTVVLTSLAARYELTRAQINCTFECELRTAHGSTTEWTFAVPPGLTVTDVLANDRAAWRFDPATRTLHVGLRQAANGGKVAVSAFASLPLRGTGAALPLIRPIHSVGSAERLELRVPPDLELEHLDSADYRITETSLLPDGSRSVVFTGSLQGAGPTAARRIPTIRVAGTEPEFKTNESLEWRIESGRVMLAARVEVRVQRGPLFRMAFRTPPDFTLDRLAYLPEDSVSYSGPSPGGCEVEFEKPLAAGQRIELRFEFRGPALASAAVKFPFPAFAPLGAGERDGWVSFSPGPAWSLAALPGPGFEPATDFDWPDTAPQNAQALYHYRGAEPTGTLVLTPVAPNFTASFDTRLDGSGPRVNATTRIDLQPKAGQLTGVRIFEPKGADPKRTWKVIEGANAIASASRIDLGRLSRGAFWNIRFVRPAAEAIVLETTASLPRELADQALTVIGAGEARTRSDRTAPPPVPANPRDWSFEGLHLITVCGESHAMVILGGAVRTRGAGTLPIALPPGAEVRAANAGGHWLEPSRCVLDGDTFRLPLPDGSGPVRFEVRYRIPASNRLVNRVTSPLPALPGDASIVRWWAVPSQFAAAWPLSLRGSTNETPMLLGEPLGEVSLYRADAETIFAVPARYADAAGAALASLLALLAWVGACRANRSLGVVLLVLLAIAGTSYWLGAPAWRRAALSPLVAAAIGTAIIAASRGWRSPPRTTIALVFVLCLIPSVAAQAPKPQREVAFIVSEAGGEVVVAPRALLDRLDQLQKRPEPGLVIGAASYTGKLEDGLARLTARFTVHSFRDGESLLDLPLADVRLERAMVDGQPAQPLVAKADIYTLPITGRGKHDIELRFAANLTMNGPEREVRFGIPEAFDSQVAFLAPLTARQLQAVGRLGELQTATEKDGIQLRAALGGLRTVHLRWREGAGGSAAAVSVREGCIWDVAESGHQLTACYQLQIQSGSITSLRFDLPAGLEPTRVAVRSLDSILVPAAARDWNIGKENAGLRPLTINLLGPTDGRILVTIECEPRTAPTRQPVLGFPRPVGMTRTLAVYGLRPTGVTAESIARTGVIDYASDALAREFGSIPDLRLAPQSPVIAFSPRPGEAAELRPVLRLTNEPPTFSQDVAWDVDAKLATGHGTLKWTGAEPASLIEFAVTAAIGEVRGAEVASWAQADGRLQVWLRKPMKEGSLEWFGSAPGAGTFEPPLPAPVNARIGSQTVRIHPAAGLGVRIERDKGWKPGTSSEREWVFHADGAMPPPRVQLVPASPSAGRGFGLVEFSGSEVSYRAAVEIPITPNQPHHLVLRANGLAAWTNAVLDVPPGTIVHPEETADRSREWSLDVPASAAATFRATVTLTLASKTNATLPEIDFRAGGTVPSANGVVRAIGLSGTPRDVQLDGAVEASGTELASLQTAWPGKAERLRRSGGTMWRTDTGRATLVFPVPEPRAPAPPQPASTPTSSPSVSTSPLPILPALMWCGTVIAVLVLFVRSPRGTWPEQIGLLGGLLGFALAGEFAIGIVAYAAARIAWLFKLVRMPTRR